jgi:DNA-binding PadR family transcriptional regulator
MMRGSVLSSRESRKTQERCNDETPRTTHGRKEPIFGLGIIEELGRHGYKLSAGTLYPILHGLERRGYLKSKQERNGKRFRRVYRATAKGRKALDAAKEKVRELFGELFEDD